MVVSAAVSWENAPSHPLHADKPDTGNAVTQWCK